MKTKFAVSNLICLSLLTLLYGCSVNTSQSTQGANNNKIKNVIFVIGDGMGPQQLGLLLSYARQAPHSVIQDRSTAFDRMLENQGVLGVSMTYPAFNLVADSAASASQLATGKASGSEMIGLDKYGNEVSTVLELAKRQGKSTGLVSDTRITHATPAGFAAHQSHRSKENEIALDMLKTGPDVMLSGGLRHWIPSGASKPNSVSASDAHQALLTSLPKLTASSIKVKSKRKDDRNLLLEAKQQGYELAFTREQLKQVNGKVLGLFANSIMADGIQNTRKLKDPKRTEPSLKEMSEKAIEVLDKNENGFFLMIEAGQIDWAGHYNDTGTMLHELLKLNETLNYVLDWAENRDDTLIIVTADHETGGFGFSYSANDLPQATSLRGSAFTDDTYHPQFNFGHPQVLDKLYQQKISYSELFFEHFDALPKSQQNAEKLVELVNAYTDFPIDEAQAAKILKTKRNPFYHHDHPYLSRKVVPQFDVNEAFFVYQNRLNLLAMEVSKAQQVVWATGSHTATPVLVFVNGPKNATAKFSKVLHHTDIGHNIGDLLQ